jgi:AcrR family transcriptional regulator
MYQDRTDPSERILDETIRLLGARASMPSVRDVAAAAGVSPALVVYRFGDMDALRQAAFEAARRLEDEIWRRRRSDYLSAPLTGADLAGLLCELLADEAARAPDLAAVRWLRSLKALRESTAAGAAITAPEEAAFWAGLGDRLGLSREAERLCTAFYHGLAFGHVIAAGRPGFLAWSSAVTHRFAKRLLGCVPTGPGPDSAFRAAAARAADLSGNASQVRLHPTRHAILEAAIRILVDEGAASLTHRRLAAEAGASASSVIHFFDDRRSIVREAYGQLYVRLRTRALLVLDETGADEGALTPRQLADGLLARGADVMRANELGGAGLLNAMFEASRDAETTQLAVAMFALIGETSKSLLARIEGCRGSIGWLDAQALRLVFNGQIMLRYDPLFLAPDLRDDLEAAAGEFATALALMFGPAPAPFR